MTEQILIRSPYYVPRIREILAQLGGAKFFTTMEVSPQRIREKTSLNHTFAQERRVPHGDVVNMGYYTRQLAPQSR